MAKRPPAAAEAVADADATTVTAPEEQNEQPRRRRLRPMKVQLAAGSPLSGYRDSVSVHEGGAFRLEPGDPDDSGLWLYPREESDRRCFWVPYAQIQFVEFEIEIE